MKILLLLGTATAFFVTVSAFGGYGDRREKEDADSCRLPLEVGTCNLEQKRYYFSARHRMCKEFIWKGCKKNANHFRTRTECYRSCGAKCGRKPAPYKYHSITFAMDNDFYFYQRHEKQYTTALIAEVCKFIPVSTKEVIVKAWRKRPTQTNFKLIIKRDFIDNDKIKELMRHITEGWFKFQVAGRWVASVKGEDVHHSEFESPEGMEHRKSERCKRIIMIIVIVLVILGAIIGIIWMSRRKPRYNVKHKKTTKRVHTETPEETNDTNAQKAFEAIWSTGQQNLPEVEKVEPPPNYDTVVPEAYKVEPPFETEPPTKSADNATT